MSRDVLWVRPQLGVRELSTVLLERRVSGVPVVGRGRVMGVVSVTDVLYALHAGWPASERFSGFYLGSSRFSPISWDVGTGSMAQVPGEWRVEDIMTTRLLTVASADSIATAAHQMIERRVHRLLVVDGTRLVGIVTAVDLLATLPGILGVTGPSDRFAAEA